MPRTRPRSCWRCGARRDEERVHISWTGLCPPCSLERVKENNLQIAAGAGPMHEHRLRRTILRAHRDLAEARDAAV